MPTLTFNPHAHIILVEAEIKASHPTVARLVLDTGASRSMLSQRLAVNIGLHVNPERTIQITTATKVESVTEVIIPQILQTHYQLPKRRANPHLAKTKLSSKIF